MCEGNGGGGRASRARAGWGRGAAGRNDIRGDKGGGTGGVRMKRGRESWTRGGGCQLQRYRGDMGGERRGVSGQRR